jgi:hypothetical protein
LIAAARYSFRSSSGNFATLAAIRGALADLGLVQRTMADGYEGPLMTPDRDSGGVAADNGVVGVSITPINRGAGPIAVVVSRVARVIVRWRVSVWGIAETGPIGCNPGRYYTAPPPCAPVPTPSMSGTCEQRTSSSHQRRGKSCSGE